MARIPLWGSSSFTNGASRVFGFTNAILLLSFRVIKSEGDNYATIDSDNKIPKILRKFSWGSDTEKRSKKPRKCKARRSFVMERSKSFASHRIDGATFDVGCFTARGSRNSLVVDLTANLRRPIPVWAIGPKGGVRSMLRSMFPQFQGLFRLTKIETKIEL
jgi:hypothetical protein